jgi:hypothetical protein
MASLFTTKKFSALKFSSRKLLTSRSPQLFTSTLTNLSLRFALLGHIFDSVDLINLTNSHVPIELRYFYNCGLYFAWAEAGIWPECISEEHRTEEFLSGLKKDLLWGQIMTIFQGQEYQFFDLGSEGEGLEALMGVLKTQGERAEVKVRYDEERYYILSRDDIICTALDMAVKEEGRNKDTGEKLMRFVMEDRERFIDKLGRSRAIWSRLKEGVLVLPGEEEGIEMEYERVRGIVEERVKNGVLRPFKDKSMRELLEILDRNTVSHDEDEDNDGLQIDGIIANSRIVDGKRTVLHEPATESEIDALETKLDIVLPEGYKEFLRASNGMEGIWNGYYWQKVLAGVEIVAWSENWWGDNGLDFALVTWEELPREFDVKWPKIDLDQALVINENEDTDHVWFLKPELAKKAVDAFFEAFNALEVRWCKEKEVVERIVGDMFDGGIEGIRKLRDEWVVVKWDAGGNPPDVWGGFREFLEGLCVETED